MDELLAIGGDGVATHSEALLNEVLNGLHIVVRHLLNILDTLSIGRRKRPVDIAKRLEKAMVKILKLG